MNYKVNFSLILGILIGRDVTSTLKKGISYFSYVLIQYSAKFLSTLNFAFFLIRENFFHEIPYSNANF